LPNDPAWVPVDAIVSYNLQAVTITGEAHFLRDLGLLESAAARPRNLFNYTGETDVVALATALLAGICHNHPFEQGNKRTGFMSARAFLVSNGFDITHPDSDQLAELVRLLTNRQITEDTFAELIRPHVRTL
jgi:death-on-curing protein